MRVAFCFGADLFVLIAVLVVFGFNAIQCILALTDLLERGKSQVVAEAFEQLERRRVNADIPNVVAMVSAHPVVYQVLGGILLAIFLGHAGYTLATGSFDARTGIVAFRDFSLVVLIQWLAHWYPAAYNGLRRKLLLQK